MMMNRFFKNKGFITNLIKRGFADYRGKGGMADVGFNAQSKDNIQRDNKDANMKDQNDFKDEQKGFYSEASNIGQNEFGTNKDGIDSKNPLGKDANMGKQHTDNMFKGSSVKPDNSETYQGSTTNKGEGFMGTLKNAASKVAAGFEQSPGFTHAQKAEGQDMAMKSNIEKKLDKTLNTDDQKQGQSQFQRTGQGQGKDQSRGQGQGNNRVHEQNNRGHEQTSEKELGASDDLTEARKFGQNTFDTQKGPGLNNQEFTRGKVGRETTGDMNSSNMERDNIQKDFGQSGQSGVSSQSSQSGQGFQQSGQSEQSGQSGQNKQFDQRQQKGDNLNKKGSGNQDTPHGNFKI
jgi:hypothetical protein